ncbi:MAG: hypothetical protein QOI80_2660, partial [Solirubrobacteraceae bacterium]|nr:hypothetical protein [Solirubrobacteraceae bacterium]
MSIRTLRAVVPLAVTIVALIAPPGALATPTPTGAPTLSGDASANGNGLTCGGATFTNGTPDTYQFFRDGVLVQDDIDPTYFVSTADINHTITCKVTAIDPNDQNTAQSAASNGVLGTTDLPQFFDVPNLLPNPVHALDTATCDKTDAIDDPGGTFTYVYEWTLDGTPVAGQTGPTFAVPIDAAGKTLRCRVTATNPGPTQASSSSATSGLSASQVVQPALPTVTYAQFGHV